MAYDLAALAQQCEGAHRDKEGWRARCPVHQGKSDTSLHIWEESGQLRVHCFSQCAPADILKHFRIDLKRQPQDPTHIWSYHDAHGNLLFQVCRGHPKKFFQRRPHPTTPGAWINDVKGITPVLYRLPEVTMAVASQTPVYLVEGEKDVETLRAHGLVATTAPMGAGKWQDSYSETLKNAIVILLPDNDAPGRKHADLITTRLTGYVKSLTRIDLPDLPDGGDVSDWLHKHPAHELQTLVTAAVPKLTAPTLVFTALQDIEPEEVAWLWFPFIPRGKLTLLEGDPGGGKTYLALAIAAALSVGAGLPDAQGRTIPKASPPMATFYITAEDGLGDTLRPRAEKVGANLRKLFAVQGWTSNNGADVQAFSFQQIALLEQAIRDIDAALVVIDPLQAFLGADVDMFRANEVRPLLMQLGLMAQRTRCAILIIRHWTKVVGGKAMYRGQGNIDFAAAARSILAVGESLEDETKRVLAQSKNSLAEVGTSMVFSLAGGEFAWYGTTETDANTLASQQPRKRQHQAKAATDWLRALLKEGPMAAQTILGLAAAAGLAEKTIRRAKTSMGILAYRQDKAWFWRLPSTTAWELDDDDASDDDEPL